MTPAVKIPPLQIFGETPFSYEQIKRSFYFWFFQMREGAKEVVSASNFALIDGIWADWPPGYDATEDLPYMTECLSNPAHFQTACRLLLGAIRSCSRGLGRADRGLGSRVGSPSSQPIPYLHSTQYGCHGLNKEQVKQCQLAWGKALSQS